MENNWKKLLNEPFSLLAYIALVIAVALFVVGRNQKPETEPELQKKELAGHEYIIVSSGQSVYMEHAIDCKGCMAQETEE